jgi:hypothetical protein
MRKPSSLSRRAANSITVVREMENFSMANERKKLSSSLREFSYRRFFQRKFQLSISTYDFEAFVDSVAALDDRELGVFHLNGSKSLYGCSRANIYCCRLFSLFFL